ncbi:MAG: HEAT repeat domain-containing protein [Pseudomonadota bacterium]
MNKNTLKFLVFYLIISISAFSSSEQDILKKLLLALTDMTETQSAGVQNRYLTNIIAFHNNHPGLSKNETAYSLLALAEARLPFQLRINALIAFNKIEIPFRYDFAKRLEEIADPLTQNPYKVSVTAAQILNTWNRLPEYLFPLINENATRFDIVIAQTRHPDQIARATALIELHKKGFLGQEESRQISINRLLEIIDFETRDESFHIKQRAILLLAQFLDQEIVKYSLMKVITTETMDEDERVRLAAVKALTNNIDDLEIIKFLFSIATRDNYLDPSEEVRSLALSYLPASARQISETSDGSETVKVEEYKNRSFLSRLNPFKAIGTIFSRNRNPQPMDDKILIEEAEDIKLEEKTKVNMCMRLF